jgi:hypothetical protein
MSQYRYIHSVWPASSTSDDATLSLDFSSGTMPTAVTFTRSDSTARATYIDASGYVKTVAAAGDARFDYVGGVAKGLLVEAAATNLCLNGRYCWGGSWGTAAQIHINSVNGTSGAQYVDRIAGPDNATLSGTSVFKQAGADYVRMNTVETVQASTQYTFSMWVRAGTGGATYFRLAPFNGGSALTTVGSCSDPAVTITNGSGFGSRFSNIPSDRWVRVSVVFTTAAGQTSLLPAVYPNLETSAASTNYIWGAQLELGAQASSTIPTSTASLQRLADDAVIRSTAWTSLYSKPGSIVVEYYRGEYGAGDRSVLAIDTAATKHIHLKHANASAASGIYNSAGTGVATKATGNASGLNKAAFTWSSANPSVIKYALNGNATVVSATSDIGATLGTWMTIGSASTTGVSGSGTWEGYLNNSIKSIKYYSEVLSDADMIAKTT